MMDRVTTEADYIQILSCSIAEVQHAEIFFEMGNDDQGAFRLRAGFNIRTLRTVLIVI